MRISDWSSDVCSSDLRTGQRQPQVGGMATHADRAVAPWLQAAGREYPIAFGGLELESSRQRQVQEQPSSRHLQSRAASAGMDEMQGLPPVWIELKRTGEVQARKGGVSGKRV